MSDNTHAGVALRMPTRVCLLCHSLTETEQSLVAVIGEKSFDGYTRPFLYLNNEKNIVKWRRPMARGAYASICSPKTCWPYCCRTSPHVAFLLHEYCVRTLQGASRTSVSKRDIWNFVRYIQPRYRSYESVGIHHQIRSFITSIYSADLTKFQVEMAVLLDHIRNLPTELQLMILDFTGPCLGLSLATVLLETLPLLERTQASTSASCQLNIYPDKTYVRYEKIRGQNYISEISNHCRAGMKNISCASQPDYVILSLDDLGIRDICFNSKKVSSKPIQAPWYQHDELGDVDQVMLVTKSPFVVREIAPLRQVAVRYLWDLPLIPNILDHQWYKRDKIVKGSGEPFYMKHVDVDQPLTGLAVACDMWTNMSFYAHPVNCDRRSSERHMKEVEYMYGDALVWVYFPMSPGEKICGFWVLTTYGGLATVAIYTSHGRSHIFGPYHEPEDRDDMIMHPLNGTQDGHVSTIFYNNLRSNDTARDVRLAVSSTQEDTMVEVPQRPPWPINRIPSIFRHLGQSWYHSQAPLKGLRHVNICRDNTTQLCLGIEIHYHEHSTEFLGQWRFDQSIEMLQIQDDTSMIHVQTGFVGSIPCIKNIQFELDKGVDEPGWRGMALEGCLVWWYSRLGGFVTREEDMIAH